MHTVITILSAWLALSVLASGAWCLMTEMYGTRDCNGPAIRATKRAQAQARRDFVATHMTKAL